MTRSRAFWLVLLTVLYLIFELRFNAILLEAVGSSVPGFDIDKLETQGRMLTACAVSLFVLQWFLSRIKLLSAPWWVVILVSCGVVAVATVVALKHFSEYLVETASGEFRSAALASTHLKKSMVEGAFKIVGVPDPTSSLASGQGKAFLTLMPLVAACSTETSAKVQKAAPDLSFNDAEKKVGSIANVYKRYTEAVKEVEKGYSAYQKQSDSGQSSQDETAIEEKAWQDYLAKLARKGYTPYTIAKSRWPGVITEVQKQIPVPDSWDITDELTFKRSVRDAAGTRARALSVAYSDLPKGLSWNEFFEHPHIQQKLRAKLGMGNEFRVRSSYETQDQFRRDFYAPLLRHVVNKLSDPYKRPMRELLPGKTMAKLGAEVASIAIVPPLAIAFSLTGAITHAAKLMFLLLRLMVGTTASNQKSAVLDWLPSTFAAFTFGALIYWVSHHPTELTTSPTYKSLISHAQDGPTDWACQMVQPALVHGIIVGQRFLFPLSNSL